MSKSKGKSESTPLNCSLIFKTHKRKHIDENNRNKPTHDSNMLKVVLIAYRCLSTNFSKQKAISVDR